VRSQKSKSIVLVQYSSNSGGSTVSGLLIARALLSSNWKVHVVFGFPGAFEEIYRSEGCSTEVVPHSNWLRTGSFFRFPKNWLAEIRKSHGFEKIFNDQRPRIVYINSLVSLAAAIGAKNCGIPVVWHLRELFTDVGGEMHAPPFFGKRLIRAKISQLSKRFICISDAVAENLLGLNLTEKASVIPNAVDKRFFKSIDKKIAREELALPPDGPVIGVPGTLRPMKGHNFLFNSSNQVIKLFPNAIIAISGDLSGPYANTVKAQANAAGIGNRCRFLGNIKDMRLFYSASDVICVPSSSEPFGRTIIEGFASNRPVIGSAVGGITETINDGVNGFLVEYNDTQKLSKLLIELLENKPLADKISQNARHCADVSYTESICGERIKTIIDQTLRNYEKRGG
jgi:glycosyltransferase involved in cell wall biosynthesis